MEKDNSIDAVLAEAQSLLHGANYQVSLQVFRVPFVSGAGPEQYIVAALCKRAEIGGLQTVAPAELAKDVEASLRYAGNDDHGPKAESLSSPRFNELVACVLQHLAVKCQQSTAIYSFWFKDGHPFYPVFWDFAYLLVAPGTTEVFDGSSSD